MHGELLRVNVELILIAIQANIWKMKSITIFLFPIYVNVTNLLGGR